MYFTKQLTRTYSIWLLLLSLYWTACAQSGDQEGLSERLTVNELAQFIKDNPNVQLVDVRTSEEFQAGHLDGAMNMDFYADDFEQRLAALDLNRPTVLYCAKGGRSYKAYLMGKKLEFVQLHDLEGGYTAWIEAHHKE